MMLASSLLAAVPNLRHAFFTREGGVSDGIYASLNGGLGSLLQEAAGKLGVDQNQLLGQLSQVLPHAVDHLTPNGEVPEPAAGGGFDLGSLASLAGKLLGGSPA